MTRRPFDPPPLPPPDPAFVRAAVERAPSPSYVCDLGALERNLRILAEVSERSGATVLLALKGFALWSAFPLVRRYLAGAAASSLNEARLAREELGGEVHVYAPAFKEEEFPAILELADTVVFNSWNQWERFAPQAQASARKPELGVRINPGYSEVEVETYNPCAPRSRLGIPVDQYIAGRRNDVRGILFHTHCEQNADALARTLEVVEERLGNALSELEWVNFGGGHHITRPDYDRDLLVDLVKAFRSRHGTSVYLEPGEAAALNAGVLVATVLDIVENEGGIAILDTSATAHMPDVIEMPYRPAVLGAGRPGEHPYMYRLGGLTCLAGDVIGDYSFPRPLAPGDRLVFCDMAHYTMVKNTTFNGVPLPAICLYDPAADELRVVRRFGYEDYKGRLS